MSEKIAVVTGGNRGIGKEVVRQLAAEGWRVLLGSRDLQAGRAAAKELEGEVEAIELDVTDPAEIAALAERVRTLGGADALVDNAGASFDGFDASVAERTLAVNFFGALAVADALLPHLRKNANVVLVSSGMGDRDNLSGRARDRFEGTLDRARVIEGMRAFIRDVKEGRHRAEGWPSNAYSVSKVGVTALAGVLARELAGDPRNIHVNAACPGWVRTRMGGRSAPRSVEDGADTLVWLATSPPDGPTGGYFRDRAPAEW